MEVRDLVKQQHEKIKFLEKENKDLRALNIKMTKIIDEMTKIIKES
jgi:hypothetical protein